MSRLKYTRPVNRQLDTLYSYTQGVHQAVALGCRYVETIDRDGGFIILALPRKWRAETAPPWTYDLLTSSLHAGTVVRDSKMRPRILLEEKKRGSETTLITLHVLTRFAVTPGTDGQAYVIDRAQNNLVVARFENASGENWNTAHDWLDLNYPNWNQPGAYWD